MKVISKNEKETLTLGAALGRACRGGEVFALLGELGVGKTKFLQGLAKGLGVKGRVNSPTFNIWKMYKIKDRGARVKIFCHLDAYRLRRARDLASLGVEEYFSRPDTVVAIEWAEKVKKIWPEGVKIIKIRQKGNYREISLKQGIKALS